MKDLTEWLLRTPDGLSSEEARQYVFFKWGYPNGAATHFAYAVIFALNGIAWLAWYNLVVTGLFALAGLIFHRVRNPLWHFVPLWLVEIPLHAALGTWTAGVLTMFWWLPITSAVCCLITPSLSWPVRIALASALTLYAGALFVFGFLHAPGGALTPASELAFFVCNFGVMAAIVLYVGIAQRLVEIAEARQREEFDRAEGLLLNILPKPIADRLKTGERVIADDHREVSVVFADIVDFTSASARVQPAELVETLNTVFSEFDAISDRHGAEKIKTIGDAYMVVVGVPNDRRHHAEAAVDVALEMQAAAARLSRTARFPIRLRIGINSGPVVAGVIGQRKFAYDLWGDAVNVASRMESHCAPDMILITEATAALLPERYRIVPQGTRDVKGKGVMTVFSVEGEASACHAAV